MASPVTQWVHGGGRLYFGRQADGGVIVAIMADDRSPDDPSGRRFAEQLQMDAGSWASIVLCMTVHSERPNDWHAFMAHHLGKSDLLQSEKTLQTVRNVVANG